MVRNKLHWDANNVVGIPKKGKSGRTGKSFFVLEVTRRYLRPSIKYSVPCDRAVQRAYCREVLQISKTSHNLLMDATGKSLVF